MILSPAYFLSGFLSLMLPVLDLSPFVYCCAVYCMYYCIQFRAVVRGLYQEIIV